MAAGNNPSVVRVFDMSLITRDKSRPSTCYRFHSKPICQAVVSPKGDTYGSISSDGKVRLWTDKDPTPKIVASVKGEPTTMCWLESALYVGMKDGLLHEIQLGYGVTKSFKLLGSIDKIISLPPGSSKTDSALIIQFTDGRIHIISTVDGSGLRRITENSSNLGVTHTGQPMLAYYDNTTNAVVLKHLNADSASLSIQGGHVDSAVEFLPTNTSVNLLLGNSSGIIQRIHLSKGSGSSQSSTKQSQKTPTNRQFANLELQIDKLAARLNTLHNETLKMSERTQENTETIQYMIQKYQQTQSLKD